uniref:TFIID subunit TAF5 NTD2 domain-containing protein n=1 Tax=Branchiostoma floridae TaxID=7739 RepID=C3ZDV6_BRAFL|eukprot:XP_002592901.1 hypothetical protein BRAFLDRAFT_65487 [Branchiostoma floridae]
MADPNRTVVVSDGSNNGSAVSVAATGVQSSPKVDKGAGTDPSKMDQQTLAAVLQFLKNNKLKDAEAAIDIYFPFTSFPPGQTPLKDAEAALRREAKLPDGSGDSGGSSRVATSGEVSSVLSAYESEGDLARYCEYYSSLSSFIESSLDAHKHELGCLLYPMFIAKCVCFARYCEYYSSLSSFIESSLDAHKHELGCLLYPVFIHMYLQLVYNRHEKEAQKFFNRFSVEQEDWHQEDLRTLSTGLVNVTSTCTLKTREQMEVNDLMDTFRSSKFVLRMSRDSYQSLRRYLKQNEHRELLSILQDHLFIDVFDGVPRNREQDHLFIDVFDGVPRNREQKEHRELLSILQDHLFIDVFDGVPRNGEQNEHRELLSILQDHLFIYVFDGVPRNREQNEHRELLSILQDHLFIDVFDGVPRNREQEQVDEEVVLNIASCCPSYRTISSCRCVRWGAQEQGTGESRDVYIYKYLKDHLFIYVFDGVPRNREQVQVDEEVVLKQNEHRSILQDHLFIDVFDGVPRNREQVQATSGAMMGEARRDANKVKVLYGLPKRVITSFMFLL